MTGRPRLTDRERALRAWSEDDLHAVVTDLATACGWTWWHFRDSRRQVRPGVFVGDEECAGFPDLVLAHPRRRLTLFRELKRETGRVRPDQEEALRVLVAAGADARIWRPSDMDDIRTTLTGFRRTSSVKP